MEPNLAIRLYLPRQWRADSRGQRCCCYLDTTSSHSPHRHCLWQDTATVEAKPPLQSTFVA
ncbi:hypothetical protein [Psychrobacter lutiphocae]|uniref:hypothetical protein n=1 Tax=Psychrobacter lutiphocae TaxID=540500 RepID=UPI0012EA2D2D|nr:hypothetical protein [Psychrobacter lutiphocae]